MEPCSSEMLARREQSDILKAQLAQCLDDDGQPPGGWKGCEARGSLRGYRETRRGTQSTRLNPGQGSYPGVLGAPLVQLC